MKHTIFLLSACCLVGILSVGCRRESAPSTMDRGKTEVVFSDRSVSVLPVVESSTKAEAPMPADATLRVWSFYKDADATSAPYSENTYIIMPSGTAHTTAVKSDGTVDPTGATPAAMTLNEVREYDFHYFSPALPFVNGTVSALTNGVDYMYTMQVHNVTPDGESKYIINSVQLGRLTSRIDVRFSVRDGETSITDLSLGAGGVQVSGLASSATYTLGQPGLNVSNTNDGLVNMPFDMFVSSGAGATTVITSAAHEKGIIVLPVSQRGIMINADLTINGATKPIQVVVNNAFAAGYKYLIDLKVSTASSFGVTVKGEPWVETNYNSNVSGDPYLGEYRNGGLVYWIDAAKAKHYRVVSIYQPRVMNLADAKAYCTGFGVGWLLPDADQAAKISAAYIANKATFDAAISKYYGIAFLNTDYWINTVDAVNAINLTTGATSSQASTAELAVRATKEVQE